MSRPQEKLSRGESVEVAQKDSESASGEALPEGWAMYPIEDFAKTATGGTPSRKRDDYYGGDIAWVKSGDLTDGLVTEVDERITQLGLDESNAKMFPKGAVCIALYGATVGKLGVLEMDASTNQAVCGIFPEDGINTQYVFHALKHERANLIGKAQGGAQPNISNGIIKKTELRVAPSAEQSRIVSAIESLQERSSRARVLLSEVGPLIGQLRQSVLRDAFSGKLTRAWRKQNPAPSGERQGGQPELRSSARPQNAPHPVSGKAASADGSQEETAEPERRCESSETASELLLRIRTERRERWEAAELAKMAAAGRTPDNDKWKDKLDEPATIGDEVEIYELPDSWEWISFAEVTATSLYGPRFGADEYDPTGIPTVRTTDMDFYGNIHLSNAPCVLIEEQQKDHFLLQQDDLVITRTGATIGKAALFDETIGDAIASAYLIRYRLTRDTVLPKFIHYLLMSPFGQTQLLDGSQAVAQPNINTKKIAAFAVPLPPLHEQREIVRALDESLEMMDSVIAIQASMESSLTQLDQSILSKAFRGELVPQDPRDEPASELLTRIRTTRAEAEAEKNAKKQNQKASKPKRTSAKPSPAASVQVSLESVAFDLLLLLDAWKKPVSIWALEAALGLLQRDDLLAKFKKARGSKRKPKQVATPILKDMQAVILGYLVGRKVIQPVGDNGYELVNDSHIKNASQEKRDAAQAVIVALEHYMERRELNEQEARDALAAQIGTTYEVKTEVPA